MKKTAFEILEMVYSLLGGGVLFFCLIYDYDWFVVGIVLFGIAMIPVKKRLYDSTL